jgi:hypothetical protein
VKPNHSSRKPYTPGNRPQRQKPVTERHLVRRAPKKNGGFSWGRFPMGDTGIVSYRLFRRDENRALHTSIADFAAGTSRSAIAEVIACKRNELRDRVDMLAFLGWEIAA